MASVQIWPRAAPWVARLAWIALAVVGVPALQSATDQRSDTVQITAIGLAAALWLIGVGAVAVMSTVTLTLARVVVPAVIPAALVGLLAGADLVLGLLTLGVAVIATAVIGSADYGQIAVQSSAYGNEVRFLLRPPIGFGVAAVIAWVLWVAASITGPLLAASRVWLPGIALIVLALVLGVLAGPRWHRLSRRWFVLVPAGVVVHDPVTLSDTLMLKRSQIRHITLAPADTEAFDLTGPASGHAIEISTTESVTVVCAPVRGTAPRAVHLTALLIAPSRPGKALRAAADRALLTR
jgi:hypothetical protein